MMRPLQIKTSGMQPKMYSEVNLKSTAFMGGRKIMKYKWNKQPKKYSEASNVALYEFMRKITETR